MIFPDAKSRRDKILEFLVNSYVELGTPVGSVTLCNRSHIDLSPATIRNIMKELEDLGYISHPHTSAGRIPTDAGYRYYVDRIMEPERITEDEQEKVSSVCEANNDEPETLLESVSRVLSEMSNEVSVALFTKPGKSTPKQTKLVSFGWHHLFQQPEFQDINRSNKVLKVLEEKDGLMRFIEGGLSCGSVRVSIGKENSCEGMQDCSIVISSYGVDNNTLGAVGVIGPTRMPYKHVMPIVNYIADSISNTLETIWQ